VDGIDLAGEEMLDWAESAGSSGVLTLAIRDLITPGSRVLLIGSADDLVRSLVTDGASVDLLLRGTSDALQASAAYAGLPVSVHSGSLHMFGETGYDVVLALGGIARLSTPERVLSWPEAAAALRRAVRPGGTVAVVVANPFSVDRIVDPRHGVRTSDDDWPAGTATRTVTGLGDALTTLDLADVRTFGLFPGLDAPAAIVEREILANGADGIAGPISATWASSPEHPATTDPHRLLRDAIRAGLGCELAPAWLFVGHTGAPLGTIKEPKAYAAGKIDRGPLLEDVLLDACDQHDLTTVRALLTRYVQQLGDVGVAFDNVVDTGDGLEVLDQSRAYAADASTTVTTIRALVRFARRLLAGAYEHPWPAGITAERLTITLAATAGLTISADDVCAAAELEPESPTPMGHREALATLARLTSALETAQAQIKFLDATVAERDRQLAELRRSITVRLGRVVARPMSVLKIARRHLRR
jgi:hypothetical protein